MNFKIAYAFPLTRTFNKVFTANSDMAFDFMSPFMAGMVDGEILCLSDENKDGILSLINEDKEGHIEGYIEYDRKSGTIKLNGDVIILIRGWGYLTGIGGLNLEPEIASAIQAAFAEHIVNKLKSINNEL